MKKIILSLCFILFTVTYLNSCKKEDPAKQNDNPPTIIEKEWTITGYKNQTGNSNADALQAQLINKSKNLLSIYMARLMVQTNLMLQNRLPLKRKETIPLFILQ